ncbi:MAG: hypothetical protein K9G24_09200 [Candidatus Nanopelagicales bacterium]|nr:hypothetical protein [Candidatus Nanopelagicales bacterium]MCF8538187.1 hypothetical protein [Candidatus Nanopelagicales bacterium]MCF8543243.1 hypothetical protein [Candidatus Nanopelagicales bacterium]MCF8558301.1 hypothetical protein [Candidatus Nanopelagicales bacterium]
MRIDDPVILGRTLRQLIGGRWAVSWLLYVVNLPLNLIGMSSNIVDANSADVGAWLIVWAVGYGVFGVALLGAHLTVLRSRRVTPVPVVMVIAVGAVAGGVRGLTVGVLADQWGISGGDGALIAVRVLTGTGLGMILIPGGALILAVLTEYHRERSALMAVRTELETARMRAQGETARLQEALVADVAEQISSDQLSAREASHRLWPEAKSRDRVRWGEVIMASILHNPFPGAAVAAIWSVSAIFTVMAAVGPLRGLLQVVSSAFAIWWIYRLARCWRPRGDLAGLAWFAVVMLATTVVTGPIASMIFDPRQGGAGNALVLANFFWLPTFTILTSICIGALRSSEGVLTRLRVQVGDDEVATRAAEQERTRLQRDIAESLHGMQSRIFASRLPGAVPLTAAELAPSADDTMTPAEIVNAVVDPWSSIMVVAVRMPDQALTRSEAREVKRIIQEGLANAYRHGQASACDVHVSHEGSHISVVVSDDGLGVAADARPGLGSAILDSLCPGDWSLTPRGNGGCTLRARLDSSV